VADDLDPAAVERAAEVLTTHQRRDSASCLCGWSRLGYSFTEHQADTLAAAGLLMTPEAVAAVVNSIGYVADIPLLAEHDAQVAARASFSAWHHGWAAGWKDHQRRTDDLDAYAQEGSTPNPYRIERQDVTR